MCERSGIETHPAGRRYNYKKTIVVYNGTDSSQAQKIADLLGVGTVKKNDGTYSFTGDYLVVVGQDWK